MINISRKVKLFSKGEKKDKIEKDIIIQTLWRLYKEKKKNMKKYEWKC